MLNTPLREREKGIDTLEMHIWFWILDLSGAYGKQRISILQRVLCIFLKLDMNQKNLGFPTKIIAYFSCYADVYIYAIFEA